MATRVDMANRPPQGSRRSGGFTLVELLLTLALLSGLLAAAVFGFSSLQRTAQLNEGVERVETAMRFARAHAANTGRKVQVVVSTADPSGSRADERNSGATSGSSSPTQGGPTPSLSILWEADPTRAPGVFEPIASLSADVSEVSNLIEIRSIGRASGPASDRAVATPGTAGTSGLDVTPTTLDSPNADSPPATRSLAGFPVDGADAAGDGSVGSSAAGVFGASGSARGASPGDATITFYPDGSCDGATLVLASRDVDDAREVALHLEGVTGTTRRQWRDTSSFGAEPDDASRMASPGRRSSPAASPRAGVVDEPRPRR